MRKLKVLWRNALSPRAVRGARNLARRAARTRRGAAALCNAEGPGRSRGRVSERRRRATLLFQAADGSYAAAAPLQTDLRISVAGVVARVRVAQRFRNSGTSYAEAVYALPLADDAAVDRLLMQVGDRVIEGEIHERQRAERIYGEARAAGQRVSLVRQTSANLFTTAVANIAPGETIDITIEYLQTARYDAGEFSLRVPLTLTPRYGLPDTPEGVSALSSAVLPGTAGNDSAMAAGPDTTARAAPRGTKRTSTRCSRPACHSSGSAAAATS